MNPLDVEVWALRVLGQLKQGYQIEDAVVELKAVFVPNPNRMARILAGMGNAARGRDILWLIGVDETSKEVLGVPNEEFSNWWQAVKAQFESTFPDIVTNKNIIYEDKTVTAIGFTTDRAPYLVKNEKFNTPSGGSVKFELPWRVGNSTDSATHNDLVQLLVPITHEPSGQVTYGQMEVSDAGRENDSYFFWGLDFHAYILPKDNIPLIIPHENCKIYISVQDNMESIIADDVEMRVSNGIKIPSNSMPKSITVSETSSEIVLDGPGRLHFTANLTNQVSQISNQKPATIKVVLLPAGFEREFSFEFTLNHAPKEPRGNYISRWEYTRS